MSATMLNRDRFHQMLENGRTIADDIEVEAQCLADKMQRIHGGDWRVRVCHDTGFISVRQR